MDTEESSTNDKDNDMSKGEEAPSVEVPGLASSVLVDILDTGLVKPTEPFKSRFKIGKKSQRISENDKSKIFDMVKDLAKYNDYEEDSSDENLWPSPKQKKGKSPRKALSTEEPSSLSKLIDSELAYLHQSDKSKPSGVCKVESTDKKAHRSGVHISSVSEEKQLEFESLLKEDPVSSTVGAEDPHISTGIENLQISADKEDKQIFAGARPKIKAQSESVKTEVAECQQLKEKVEQVKDIPKKKGADKKKSPKKKGIYVNLFKALIRISCI